MTFTEITSVADSFRRRWAFDWLDVDPPEWTWPSSTWSPGNHPHQGDTQ